MTEHCSGVVRCQFRAAISAPCPRQWLRGSIIVLSATHHAADDDGVLSLEPRRRTDERTDGRLRCNDDDNGQRRRNEGARQRRERKKQYRSATENNKNPNDCRTAGAAEIYTKSCVLCRTREYVPGSFTIRPVSAVVMLLFDYMGACFTCPIGANVVLPANFQDFIRLYRPRLL